MGDSIKVVCRLRPLNKIEIANNGLECVTYSDKEININVGGEQTKYSFAFDKIFGPATPQVAIYKQVAIPVIKSVISGFNGTIFAYGQTGGGKTWTMEGPNHHDVEFKGLIPRTIEGLFESISECDENLEFVIKSSYIQIYNEKLFDLLDPSKAKLEIKEDKHRGVFIQNCTEISVSSADQMLKTMDSGSQNRKVAFTGMNQRSSRSHSLFIIHLFQKNLKKDSTKQSKLYFVDLAGSQKVGKTGVVGQQLEEAKNINKSLSALGNVINALTSDKKQHVPYRDSKLTRILQQSLGGNSRTTLIINCSMCSYNDKQTLSTLRFGYRAKSIKNKPKVNEQRSVKQLLVLLESANKTIAELRVQLKLPPDPSLGANSGEDEKDREIAELKAELESNKRDEEERINEMETRIKQILLQLNKSKENHQITESKWGSIYVKLRSYILKMNKFVRRSYVDLQFCLNNIVLGGSKISTELPGNSRETMENTLRNIQEYELFFNGELEPVLKQIADQEQQLLADEEQFQNNHLTPEKRRTKIALSQPLLHCGFNMYDAEQARTLHQEDSQMDNMSCIVQNNQLPSFQEYSDKISQSESSEIETMLESLQTKQSQKIILEEMAASIKELRKENEDLTKKIEKMIEERELYAIKIEEKYEERILQLDERVHEYKNIMHQKDIELTKYFDEIEKVKKALTQEKVVSDRFKKIIETSGNMKAVHDTEERMRSLASERQKIFNELYLLREQLDEAEITIKQKDEHIDSLKSVMKELSQMNMVQEVVSKEEITKNYNNQVFGTETPNVVQTVKGGGLKESKKSSLRKKTQSITGISQQQPPKAEAPNEARQYLPFLKTFFN